MAGDRAGEAPSSHERHALQAGWPDAPSWWRWCRWSRRCPKWGDSEGGVRCTSPWWRWLPQRVGLVRAWVTNPWTLRAVGEKQADQGPGATWMRAVVSPGAYRRRVYCGDACTGHPQREGGRDRRPERQNRQPQWRSRRAAPETQDSGARCLGSSCCQGSQHWFQ